jgi:glycerol kinase
MIIGVFLNLHKKKKNRNNTHTNTAIIMSPKVTADTVRVNLEVLLQSDGSSPEKEFVGSIDQGTSSTRFLLFTKEGSIAAWAQTETTQIFPTTGGSNNNNNESSTIGWHEHDPLEIWNTVVVCIDAVIAAVDKEVEKQSNDVLSGYKIAAIGITNQRETTVAWNASTGKIYHNAIVWDDTRTASIASSIANGNENRLRSKAGLPLASYFAGTKVRWLLDNVEDLRNDLSTKPETVRFGTIDTWILYQLTGVPPSTKDDSSALALALANTGGIFATDVSNASRWLFLDIHTVRWDKSLVDAICGPHEVPLTALPRVAASSEVYATLTKESTGIGKLEGVPVSAILGDQQAALFGQVAFEPGEAKNTYGTGMFLMMNTGNKPVASTHGLLTTIAYKIGDDTVYALEGSVSHSGSTIQWLRDKIKIIGSAAESETIATEHNDGLYLVPAFAGLFAPHWRPDARGCIVGITAAHHSGHIARAALEAAAYQARELFEAITADSGVLLKQLKVDGGGTHNKLLMQFQADTICAPVVVPEVQETTAMGAAFAAGLAVGVWKDQQEIRALWKEARCYEPSMEEDTRQKNWEGWKKAVIRSLDWVELDERKKGGGGRFGSIGLPLVLVAALGGACGFLLGRQKR